MNNAIKTYENNEYKLSIFVDESPYSPREDDNLGTMVCFHNRYTLGDKTDYRDKDYSSWEELKKDIIKKEDVAVILPLYMYEHSGIAISTTPFSCPWDSGQIGYVFVSKEKARYEYGCKNVTKKLKERLEQYLIQEVETYNQYVSGDVYGFQLENKNTGEEDSCWGFYGSDINENGILDSIDADALISLGLKENVVCCV